MGWHVAVLTCAEAQREDEGRHADQDASRNALLVDPPRLGLQTRKRACTKPLLISDVGSARQCVQCLLRMFRTLASLPSMESRNKLGFEPVARARVSNRLPETCAGNTRKAMRRDAVPAKRRVCRYIQAQRPSLQAGRPRRSVATSSRSLTIHSVSLGLHVLV